MGYQLTIFDVLTERSPEWTEMTLKQIASYVSEHTGLNFIPDTRYHGDFNIYIAYHTSKYFFTLGISTYLELDGIAGSPFISVGYENKQELSGGAAPCDTLEDAVEWFRYRLMRPEIGKEVT